MCIIPIEFLYIKSEIKRNMKKNKKLVEKTVLNTFQEEIPSIYFSDKDKSEYSKFKDNANKKNKK